VNLEIVFYATYWDNFHLNQVSPTVSDESFLLASSPKTWKRKLKEEMQCKIKRRSKSPDDSFLGIKSYAELSLFISSSVLLSSPRAFLFFQIIVCDWLFNFSITHPWQNPLKSPSFLAQSLQLSMQFQSQNSWREAKANILIQTSVTYQDLWKQRLLQLATTAPIEYWPKANESYGLLTLFIETPQNTSRCLE